MIDSQGQNQSGAVSSIEETSGIIPTATLPKEEVERLTNLFLLKAGNCTRRKVNAVTIEMNIYRSQYDFRQVTIKYDVANVGFKPNELVMFPKGDSLMGSIAMCIGTNAEETEVFFIAEKACNGVMFWPGISTAQQFAEAGFARIVSAE
jgi:hypothetical protein